MMVTIKLRIDEEGEIMDRESGTINMTVTQAIKMVTELCPPNLRAAGMHSHILLIISFAQTLRAEGTRTQNHSQVNSGFHPVSLVPLIILEWVVWGRILSKPLELRPRKEIVSSTKAG